MQEGVVIFSQKDVDSGLMEDMSGYADDLGLTVPDMLRQIFIRRITSDMVHYLSSGETSYDFRLDKEMAHLVDRWGYETMRNVMVKNQYSKSVEVSGGVQ